MAYLIVKYQAGRKIFPIEKELVSIGRSFDCDVVLPDEAIANIHCHISRQDDGSYRILSLGNYSMLNGKEVDKGGLSSGDTIRVGDTELLFKEGVPPEEEPGETGEEEMPALKPEVSEEERVSVCQSCGKEFPGEGILCPLCSAGSALKKAAAQKEGVWSVLGDGTKMLAGLDFEEVLGMVRMGEITRYTTVKGPSTDYEWKYASETPRLCRYLNICHNCGARVETGQVFCHVCGEDLDGLGRKRADEEEAAEHARKTDYRRAASIVLFVIGGLSLAGAFFVSGLWRGVAPPRIERYLDEMRDRAGIGVKRLVGPERFEEEQKKMRAAREYEKAYQLRKAMGIYNEIIDKYPESALAARAQAGIERIEKKRMEIAVRSGINIGDNYFAEGMYEKALEKYEEMKKKYPDYPQIDKVEEKIRKTRELVGSRSSD